MLHRVFGCFGNILCKTRIFIWSAIESPGKKHAHIYHEFFIDLLSNPALI